MTKHTCTKRDLFQGYEALQRLAKQRDEKGIAWPIRVAYPISENLIKLRDDHQALLEASKQSAERLMAKGLELAVRDGKGNPLPKGNGYALRDPNAYRVEERKEEDEWKQILDAVVEIEVVQIRASDLVTAMGGENNVRLDGEDLALLRKCGVLEYDLGAAAGTEKK